MPGDPGSQPHAGSEHFLSANAFAAADVTAPLLPSEECACRLHDGVTEVLWKRYRVF